MPTAIDDERGRNVMLAESVCKTEIFVDELRVKDAMAANESVDRPPRFAYGDADDQRVAMASRPARETVQRVELFRTRVAPRCPQAHERHAATGHPGQICGFARKSDHRSARERSYRRARANGCASDRRKRQHDAEERADSPACVRKAVALCARRVATPP
jgi:hypothetical protein